MLFVSLPVRLSLVSGEEPVLALRRRLLTGNVGENYSYRFFR